MRSELLTTLINNDVSGKVNANGWARALDKFDVMQMCLRVRNGGEQAPVSGTFVDVKSDFLSAECCPVTDFPPRINLIRGREFDSRFRGGFEGAQFYVFYRHFETQVAWALLTASIVLSSSN